MILFVHDAPELGNDQTEAGYACSWVISPSRVLRELPSLRDPDSTRGCDWTEVSLSPQVVIAQADAICFYKGDIVARLTGHGASFKHAHVLPIPTGKYLMNVYSFF